MTGIGVDWGLGGFGVDLFWRGLVLEWTWTCLGRGLEWVRGGLELDLEFGWRRTWGCIPLQLDFLGGWRIRMCCSENGVLIDSFSRIWWSGLEAERWDHRGGTGEEEQYQDSPLHSCSSELRPKHPISPSGWQHFFVSVAPPTQCEEHPDPALLHTPPESVTRRIFSNTAKPQPTAARAVPAGHPPCHQSNFPVDMAVLDSKNWRSG